MINKAFNISKWFFDGISEDGRVIICYSANMQWRRIPIPYAGYLYLNASGETRAGNRFLRNAQPLVHGDTVTWQHPAFQIEGSWTAASPPLHLHMFGNEDAYVNWHCYQPSPEAASLPDALAVVDQDANGCFFG